MTHLEIKSEIRHRLPEAKGALQSALVAISGAGQYEIYRCHAHEHEEPHFVIFGPKAVHHYSKTDFLAVIGAFAPTAGE